MRNVTSNALDLPPQSIIGKNGTLICYNAKQTWKALHWRFFAPNIKEIFHSCTFPTKILLYVQYSSHPLLRALHKPKSNAYCQPRNFDNPPSSSNFTLPTFSILYRPSISTTTLYIDFPNKALLRNKKILIVDHPLPFYTCHLGSSSGCNCECIAYLGVKSFASKIL